MNNPCRVCLEYHCFSCRRGPCAQLKRRRRKTTKTLVAPQTPAKAMQQPQMPQSNPVVLKTERSESDTEPMSGVAGEASNSKVSIKQNLAIRSIEGKTGDFLAHIIQPCLEAIMPKSGAMIVVGHAFKLIESGFGQCSAHDNAALLCGTSVLHLSFALVWGDGFPLATIKRGGAVADRGRCGPSTAVPHLCYSICVQPLVGSRLTII